MTTELLDKGKIGEAALNEWFGAQGFFTSPCARTRKPCAALLRLRQTARFLLLLESVGLIAVDAKNCALFRDDYSLDLDAELRETIAFERLFRTPVWCAFIDVTAGQTTWYWISALKAIEVGRPRKRNCPRALLQP